MNEKHLQHFNRIMKKNIMSFTNNFTFLVVLLQLKDKDKQAIKDKFTVSGSLADSGFLKSIYFVVCHSVLELPSRYDL